MFNSLQARHNTQCVPFWNTKWIAILVKLNTQSNSSSSSFLSRSLSFCEEFFVNFVKIPKFNKRWRWKLNRFSRVYCCDGRWNTRVANAMCLESIVPMISQLHRHHQPIALNEYQLKWNCKSMRIGQFYRANPPTGPIHTDVIVLWRNCTNFSRCTKIRAVQWCVCVWLVWYPMCIHTFVVQLRIFLGTSKQHAIPLNAEFRIWIRQIEIR